MLPLYNLIAGAGKYQFLGKNHHPIHPFFIHKHPYPTQMKIYKYIPPPSLLQPSSLFAHPSFNKLHLLLKMSSQA